MIPVRRPAAPPWLGTLESEERSRLTTLLGVIPMRGPSKEELGEKYQRAKEILFLAQHKKCCYCEQPATLQYNPVEHFRPKLRADRGGSYPDHGYWWLAWRWDNLLFSCAICNSSHKRDHFPLADGSVALMPCEDPEGNERPLLVNPTSSGTDPRQHIQFRPMDINGKENWWPFGCTPEGKVTIKTLGLDRPELLDEYRIHAADIRRAIDLVRKSASQQNAELLLQTWQNFADQFLREDRKLLALASNVLEHHFPLAERQSLGLPS